jgi:uncharacterized protein YndB with AHSA1/START domain
MTTGDDATLSIVRTFEARPEDVFDAWLTREQWQAWIGPEGMDCKVTQLDAVVGGRYRIDMCAPDGSIIPVSGVFEVIDRPRALRFTWGWDDDPTKQSLITLGFKSIGESTEFTLRQEGLGTVENRRQHEFGWNSTLGKLARFLAMEPHNAANR